MATQEAFKSREHESVSRRTRKGRATFRVTRRGWSQIIGDDIGVSGGMLAHTDDALNARIVAQRLLSDVRRGAVGARTLDLERVTDIAYGSFLEHRAEIERVATMTGTDAVSWEQIVHADITDRSLVTVQRSYISGPYSDEDWDWFACPAAVYRSHTPRVVKRASRTRVPRGRRRQEDPRPTCRGVRLIGRIEQGQPVWSTSLAWSLVAPTDDSESRFVGHKRVNRPETRAHRSKRASVKRDARTVGTVDAPATVTGMAELLANLNRGERVVLRFGEVVRIPVTRDKSGRYAATDKRAGAPIKYRTRTAAGMAERLTA